MSHELNEIRSASLDMPESLAASFSQGQIVGGKYKILSHLGRGGVGSVYLVEQVFLKQELALKVLDGKQIVDAAQVRRFQIEAKAANSLNHPSLVTVLDFGVLENEQPYLVMEYIKGVNLTDFIKSNGPLSPEQATLIFGQLCSGMAHAHQKSIIHRDIKPSNIMLSESVTPGTPGSVKIVDFGIAKFAFDQGGEIQSLTRTGEIFGSPLYMSPEQCSGGAIDHRSDIYSLGCALFEALTGTPPHVGTNQLRTMMLHVNEPAPMLREASLGTQFPAELERIVQKLLQKQPSERYQNFDDVARDLSVVYSSRTAPTAPPEVPQSKAVRRVENLEISAKRLAIYLALASLTSAVLTASVIQTSRIFVVSKKNPPPNSVVPPTIATSTAPASQQADPEEIPVHVLEEAVDRNSAAEEAFTKAHKISSRIETSGEFAGQRVFNFPDIAIGRIFYGKPLPKLALKTQHFPPAVPLSLDLGGSTMEAFDHPKIYEKVNSNDFVSLKIFPPATRRVQDLTAVSIPREAENLASILTAFSNSKTIETVSLGPFALSEKSLHALDRMQNLKEMTLYGNLNADFGKYKHPVFQRLKTLILTQAAHVEPVLNQLSGTSKLEAFDYKYNAYPADFFAKLATCHSLSYLRLEGGEFNDRWVPEISRLRSLRMIAFVHVSISSEQLEKVLAACPQIQKIQLLEETYAGLAQSGQFSKNPRVAFEQSK